jgi:hypothetical protein
LTAEQSRKLAELYARTHQLSEERFKPEENTHLRDYSTDWPSVEMTYAEEMAFWDEATKIMGEDY